MPADVPHGAAGPTEGPTARQVMTLAWPMTLKAIILHGTVVIDGLLVSALGETALAGMGLAAALAGFVLGTIFAFSSAMQIRTAQASGTGDPVFLKSALVSGLSLSVVIGVFGVLVIWIAGPSLIALMAPTSDVAALAWTYLSVFSLVILGETIGQSLASYYNGIGETRIPLYSFCLSLPMNVLASIALIHGLWGLPALGVAGAAVGSALAIAVQVAFLGVRLLQCSGHLRAAVGWRNGSFAATVKRHVAFSLPIAATFVSATVATHVCTLIYARLSLNEFAAMTLIAPWIMVAGTIGMQWAIATGIIVAQLLGNRTAEEVLDRFLRSAWRGAFVAAALVSIVFFIVCVAAPILYADLDIETRTILIGFLPVLLVLPFPKGSNAICGNTLRASGDTIYVMHIFLWSQWLFRVPATALAVIYFEIPAVWVLSLLLIEEFVKLPAFHRRLFKGHWKRAVFDD